MAEPKEAPLPSLDAFRTKLGYLLDRRAISHGALAAHVRQAHPELTLNQSTISRFMKGADISYGLAFRMWNVLLDLQPLRAHHPIDAAMVPWKRVICANPNMTIQEFTIALGSQDFDFAPFMGGNKISAILDVKIVMGKVRKLPPTESLETLLLSTPTALYPAPNIFQKNAPIANVRAAMEAGVKIDPSRALALVKEGKQLVGLVTPYNFIGVVD